MRPRKTEYSRSYFPMSSTYSRVNASAATLTKNRTEGSVVPASGMCVTCVDGCIGMCEIGKSAYRGHEVIYPQPFGVITTAAEKTYPVDYSHFNIMGTCVGAPRHRSRQRQGHLPGREPGSPLWPRPGPQVPPPLDHPRHRLDEHRQEQLGGGWRSAPRWPERDLRSARTSPAWIPKRSSRTVGSWTPSI